ncbi:MULTISPECIES: DUF3572 domain-containing protein [Falsihalocynthiibacter]|nr:DUF3572 domain-containing protein [Falsihalocynthiibacter arcticus]
MDEKSAHTVAIQTLGWLASEDDLWDVFLGSSGANIESIKTSAQDPIFLGSVLDFLMMDDAWVMRACGALSMPNETLMQARQALPGGRDRSWT